MSTSPGSLDQVASARHWLTSPDRQACNRARTAWPDLPWAGARLRMGLMATTPQPRILAGVGLCVVVAVGWDPVAGGYASEDVGELDLGAVRISLRLRDRA